MSTPLGDAVDPFDPNDRQNLFKAISASRRDLEPFRCCRLEMVKQFVGKEYGENAARYSQIINLMYQAADIYTIILTANRPRVMVTAYNPNLKGFAARFELAVNNYAKTMGIEQVLEACVLDAFFMIGVAKVYLADSTALQLDESTVIDPGKPWVKQISLDDFVYDTKVKRWDEVRFIGDTYRVPLKKLQEDTTLYDPDVVRMITSTGLSNEAQGEQTVASITTGRDASDDDEMTPMVSLLDVYLPQENKVCTWPMSIKGESWEGKNVPPLAFQDWDGPENPCPTVLGPYHILGFTEAPDNTMPVSPALNLAPLSDLANNLFRKLERQARRQKTYHIFRGGAEPDAHRQKKVSDGGFVRVDDPQSQSEVHVGGVDQGNLAFADVVIDKFDRIGGNIPAMGGLGASADTVGQEKLISGQNSRREAKMQYRVVRFARNIMVDIGHLMFYDPVLEVPGEFQIPGSKITVDANWTPEMREGEYIHYNLDVEPYSMAYRSPMQRAQEIMQYMQNVIIPLAPMLQQQGGIMDMQAFNELMSDLMNEPALSDIVKFTSTITPEGRPEIGDPPPKAQHTVRENVRHSVAHGMTGDGAAKQRIQQFMNSAQANPPGRPTAGAM